jgi:hypothetical protein
MGLWYVGWTVVPCAIGEREFPQHSWMTAIVLDQASMPVPGIAKRRLGERLGSGAADSGQTRDHVLATNQGSIRVW